ncbi:MAG: S8 family serine peptidase [Rhodothermia bacterium]|nr:S8 family serine peptidase [Rhodothermia bacterium]
MSVERLKGGLIGRIMDGTNTTSSVGCVRRALILLAFACIGAEDVALGQVELIVRPADGSELLTYFDAPAKATDVPGSAELLNNVSTVVPLLTAPRLGKTGAFDAPVFIVTVQDSAAFRDLMALLTSRQDVSYVQPNYTYTLDASERVPDPFADSLSHFSVVEMDGAWSITDGSKDVVVGLIDTGIYFDHPDLAGQIATNAGEDLDGNGILTDSDINGIDDDGNGYIDDVAGYDFVDRPSNVEEGDFRSPDPDASDDGSGHGTNVAGIVAATRENGIGIVGVAPGVTVMPIRAFGRDGRGDDDDIARAIIYGTEAGASVLNLSFGDTHLSPLMRDAIRFAVNRGVTVVASAGNNGGDDPHYPSDYPEVISVVWLDRAGAGAASRATFGTGVDIGAPGSAVFTTTMPTASGDTSDDQLYGRRSGSSMAAPMVSAAAALVKSVMPELSPGSVRSVLAASAADIGETGWDHRTGAGLLQVATAVRRALPARVEITRPGNDEGTSEEIVRVVGSVLDPSFESYEVSVASGGTDGPPQDWTVISGPVTDQVLEGTLGEWNTGSFADGPYVLRLRAMLRTGKSIEDRRRVFLDRTQPQVTIHLLDDGLVGGMHAVVADVESDDLGKVELDITLNGRKETVVSDRISRRHGLVFVDSGLAGGVAQVEVRVVNATGLSTTAQQTVFLPRNSQNSGAVSLSATQVPHGFLLDTTTDFDNDGLPEIVLNIYKDGWLGDTLAVYEWNGDLRRAASLIVATFPRGQGDSDGDGLIELLTQVGPSTVILEQEQPNGYPSRVSFVDTTGFSDSDQALWGARIFDLDADGVPELIGHNSREWIVRAFDGSDYVERARLENPTSVLASEIGENSFEQPQPLVGDLDRDGLPDMLAGDSDGDWILFESSDNDQYAAVWTYETDRYNAGSRLISGDFDGDGANEVVTYTHNWLTTTSAGTNEPDIGLYYLFDVVDDNSLALRDSIAIPGEISAHGTIAAADIDGDGQDELVIVNPPDLYLLRVDSDAWSIMYHTTRGLDPGFDGTRSIKAVTGDLDLDGSDEVVIGSADGRLYVVSAPVAVPDVPAPNWVSLYALDSEAARLEWAAAGMDSTWIYRAENSGELDPVGASASSIFIDSVSTTSEYALRGWRAGVASPLSRLRTVRPHPRAIVEHITYPAPGQVEIEFTERMPVNLKTTSFTLSSGATVSGLLLTRNDRAVLLSLRGVSGPDTLRLANVTDAEGTPVGQESVPVVFPGMAPSDLIVRSWQVLSRSEVLLTFSENLVGNEAVDVANYGIEPTGRIRHADWSPDRPDEVLLGIEGTAIGATGLETVLTVERMSASSGNRLSAEGAVIRLSNAASNLDGVFVFPNPLVRSSHSEGLMIAGLPTEARVQIFSSSGQRLRDLQVDGGLGGVRWSLTDESGTRVPSGVYLIRITAKGMGATLKKAAIID